MAPIDLREFGRLEEKVEAQGRQIEAQGRQIDAMDAKIDELLALANQGRGGFWAGMAIVSMASSVVGWVSHTLLNR